jgi:hypothetical protein
MKPKLAPGEYVFCTVKPKLPLVKARMVFEEEEGTTLILEKKLADKNSLPYSGTWSLVTLTVHSDLAAVGLLAAITEKLAKSGISVNAVSAYYHDHLFVPKDRAKEAMALLAEFSQE